MSIKPLIDEHTAKLHSLAYERSIITDRLAVIAKEMSELTGVVNALLHVGRLESTDGDEDENSVKL